MGRSLPLIDDVIQKFALVDLQSVGIIANQHLLSSNIILFDALIKKGLKPENIFLIGKPYSTNLSVMNAFKHRNIFVHPASVLFDSHLSFDASFSKACESFLKKASLSLSAREISKVILMDDGGYLIPIAESYFKKNVELIGIEQTTSGYTRIKSHRVNFPVINVARSKTKLAIESPFIAEVAVKRLKKSLKRLKLKPKTILVIGGGSIGLALFEKLKEQFETSIFDIDSSKSHFSEKSLIGLISYFDLIVGATGESVYFHRFFSSLVQPVILVSVSSSDREFSAVEIRKKLKKVSNPHYDFKWRNIWLLNGGFPINFDGSADSVPPKKIQLTRSLMLAAVLLGVTQKYPNQIVPLDPLIESFIVKKFKRLVN